MLPRELRSLPRRTFWLALVSCVILVSGLVLSRAPAVSAVPAPQKKACIRALHHQFSHRPRHLTTASLARLTSILGVLQRPATPADTKL
jgi:hypothetical protein